MAHFNFISGIFLFLVPGALLEELKYNWNEVRMDCKSPFNKSTFKKETVRNSLFLFKMNLIEGYHSEGQQVVD
jgi:hypothetical protein